MKCKNKNVVTQLLLYTCDSKKQTLLRNWLFLFSPKSHFKEPLRVVMRADVAMNTLLEKKKKSREQGEESRGRENVATIVSKTPVSLGLSNLFNKCP